MSATSPLTEEQAHRIYDVLQECAGASASHDDRMSFVYEYTSSAPTTEWRFQGSLGFGGKFRYFPPNRPWYVDCYPEDLTPERKGVLEKTNARLQELFASHI